MFRLVNSKEAHTKTHKAAFNGIIVQHRKHCCSYCCFKHLKFKVTVAINVLGRARCQSTVRRRDAGIQVRGARLIQAIVV
jgi:hypothetical protein